LAIGDWYHQHTDGIKIFKKTIEYTAACVALIGSNYVFKKHTPVKNPFVTFSLVSGTAEGGDSLFRD